MLISVDSIKAYLGLGRRSFWVVPLYVIDWMPTTISRSISLARAKFAEFDVNRELS